MFSTKVNNSSANELTAAELLWVQTGATGVLELLEGAAPSHTSGTGKLYVKSSDSKLYFKNDSGTEFDLTAAASSGANTALSNLASVAINTTLVSDTDNTDSLGTAAISWSDLFLGSGAVITFSTAPSTSDVTITHSSNTLSIAGGTVTFDTAPTPSSNDAAALGTSTVMWSDLFLASGAVVNFNNGDVTVTHSLNSLSFAGASSGYTFDALISPATNDAAALGTTALGWSDLHLATGGVINWANGEVTLTETDANTLTLAGASAFSLGTSTALTAGTIELGAASDTTISRSAAGKIAVEGVDVLTVAGGTLTGSITLGENTGIALDPAGSADGKWSGITIAGTAGYAQTFGDLVYLDPTDSRWEKCDANSAAGADGDSRGIIGIVVVAGVADGNACTILLHGVIRADAAFPAFTINNPIYVSETAGAVTQTQPTTTDVVIRIVGFALTADEMYFNPENDYITHI